MMKQQQQEEISSRDQALRRAVLPFVEDIIIGLMKQGMSKETACKSVRWATHIIEFRRDG